MEARMILAPPMAALAAERATQSDIEELERIWQADSEAIMGSDEAGDLIQDFHLKLAAMTRNPALEAAARPLIQLVTLAFGPAAGRNHLAGQPSILSLQWAVLDAVRNRQAEGASLRMVELMEAAYARLTRDNADFTRAVGRDIDMQKDAPFTQSKYLGLKDG
jgi:DNA-binding FadR family transcriptional regulator